MITFLTGASIAIFTSIILFCQNIDTTLAAPYFFTEFLDTETIQSNNIIRQHLSYKM